LVSIKGVREKAKIAKALEFSQSIQTALGAEAVGIWSFDEGPGNTTVKDSSGYGNDGTINGGAIYTSETPHKVVGKGAGKYALSFDGASGYVDVPGKLGDFSNAITIEAWMRVPNPTKWRNPIVGSSAATPNGLGVNIFFGAYSDAAPSFAITIASGRPGVNGAPNSIKANTWQHYVGVYDGAYVKLFLDGQLAGSTPATGNIANPSGGILIGQYDLSSSHAAEGLIDEVRIYSRALSVGEIQKHYAEGAVKLGLVKK